MKKAMQTMFFVVAFLTLLCACGQSGAAGNSASKKANSNSSKSDIQSDSDYDLNFVTRIEGALDVYPGKDGIYFAGIADYSSSIAYLDEKTGVTTALCNRLECRHSDESCTAYIGNSAYTLFMNSDKSKLFVTYNEAYSDTTAWPTQNILMLDANGENRKNIYSINHGELKRNFAFSGDEMFFTVYIVNPETAKEQYDIINLNYQTGENYVVESFPNTVRIIGAYDNFLILDSGNGSLESASSDIIKYNVDTKEKTQLFHYETHGHEYNATAFADSKNLYIIEPNGEETAKLSRLDMTNDELTVLTEQMKYYGVHSSEYMAADFADGYMFLRMSTPDDTEYLGARQEMHVINLKNGTQKEISLKNQYGRVYIFLYSTNENYIIYTDSKEMPVIFPNADGTSSQGAINVSLFATCKKDDFLNSVDKSVPFR